MQQTLNWVIDLRFMINLLSFQLFCGLCFVASARRLIMTNREETVLLHAPRGGGNIYSICYIAERQKKREGEGKPTPLLPFTIFTVSQGKLQPVLKLCCEGSQVSQLHQGCTTGVLTMVSIHRYLVVIFRLSFVAIEIRNVIDFQIQIIVLDQVSVIQTATLYNCICLSEVFGKFAPISKRQIHHHHLSLSRGFRFRNPKSPLVLVASLGWSVRS